MCKKRTTRSPFKAFLAEELMSIRGELETTLLITSELAKMKLPDSPAVLDLTCEIIIPEMFPVMAPTSSSELQPLAEYPILPPSGDTTQHCSFTSISL